MQEMRERIKDSIYWEDRRSTQKCIRNFSTLAMESLHLGWWIYGQFVYYSPEAYECSESESSLMDFVSIFLLMQTFKVTLFFLALLVVCLIMIFKFRTQKNARDQSKGIVRSLSAMKYHALV